MAAIGLLKTGCTQNSEPYVSDVAMENVIETHEFSATEGAEAFDTQINPAIAENLKIIKSANCRFKVADVDSVTSLTKAILFKHQGYVSEMRFQNTSHQLENRLNLKVPAKNFEEVLQELTRLAEYVDFKNISTSDVSEEYVDLQTRLKTKLLVKERYDQILRSKAKTVEEVLLAEEKLRVLQEEIEASQGRLKFLSNKVALSTIQLDLYETVEHRDKPDSYAQSFTSKMKDSLAFGWKLVQNLFLGVLYIWPLVLGVLGLIFFLKYRKK